MVVATIIGPLAGLAQLVERQFPKLKVAGSRPVARSTKSRIDSRIARPRLTPMERSSPLFDEVVQMVQTSVLIRLPTTSSNLEFQKN